MTVLTCTNLIKRFGDVPVVDGVSLSARAGQLITLLGPSGCGKTTTLRLIAGFEWPDSGTITVGGRHVAGEGVRVPPEDRRIGMVFQEYALFPHLDVAGNIAFGLKGSKADKDRRVREMLTLVGLAGLDKRMTYALSGGQQQRVALARALAPQPEILLLDEPFSNLDAALRAQVRSEVRAILKQTGITCVFVTHDQEEALSLSDQVAVMFEGKIAQFGPPQQIYSQPISRTVAAFVGEANFLPGEAAGDSVHTALGTLALQAAQQGSVEVLIRPEALRLSLDGLSRAVVEWTEFYGHDQRVGVRLDTGEPLVARGDAVTWYERGQRVRVAVEREVQAFQIP